MVLFPSLSNVPEVDVRSRVLWAFKKICGKTWHGTDGDKRLFASAFGVSLRVCLRLWGMCLFPSNFSVEHFMDTLYFMKTYPTLDVLEMKLSFSRKTIVKNNWYVIKKIASLAGQVVSSSFNLDCCCVFFPDILPFFVSFTDLLG